MPFSLQLLPHPNFNEESRVKSMMNGKKEEKQERVSITSSPLPAYKYPSSCSRKKHLFYVNTNTAAAERHGLSDRPTTWQKYRLFERQAMSAYFQVIMLKKDPLRHLITKGELKDGSAQARFKHRSRLVGKCHQLKKLIWPSAYSSLSMPYQAFVSISRRISPAQAKKGFRLVSTARNILVEPFLFRDYQSTCRLAVV